MFYDDDEMWGYDDDPEEVTPVDYIADIYDDEDCLEESVDVILDSFDEPHSFFNWSDLWFFLWFTDDFNLLEKQGPQSEVINKRIRNRVIVTVCVLALLVWLLIALF